MDTAAFIWAADSDDEDNEDIPIAPTFAVPNCQHYVPPERALVIPNPIESYCRSLLKGAKPNPNCVMNHIPLHPFAIKSHPNLIPSLRNLPPTFLPFLPFPDTPLLRRSITRHLSLHHPSPITLSHRHSIVIILHYQFPSLLSFVISDLFCPY